MSNASYWGCDIGGGDNTYIARLAAGDSGLTLTTYGFDGSTLEVAQHIWHESRQSESPIFLVIDAALSHSLASPQGWRPCDKWLQEKIDPALRNVQEQLTPGRQYSSRVVSPNGLRGYRGLELTQLFGAYCVMAETHPTANLVLMGAACENVLLYKKNESHLHQLGKWLTTKLGITEDWQPNRDGELDAAACAAVAAAMGGRAFEALRLITPVLGNTSARERSGLPRDRCPSPYLVGSAPYYLLANAASDTGLEDDAFMQGESSDEVEGIQEDADTCNNPNCLLYGRPLGVKECPFCGWVKPDQGKWNGIDGHILHNCPNRPEELTYQDFKAQVCIQHWPR